MASRTYALRRTCGISGGTFSGGGKLPASIPEELRLTEFDCGRALSALRGRARDSATCFVPEPFVPSLGRRRTFGCRFAFRTSLPACAPCEAESVRGRSGLCSWPDRVCRRH